MERNPFAIDVDVLKTLFRQYRTYFIPIGIILVCIALVLIVIVPQIQVLMDLQKEEKTVQERIAALKKNVAFVKAIEDAAQDAGFRVAVRALPTEKDYIGILTAVSVASQQAGVSTGDFSFQVGSLTAKDEKSSVISLTLSIIGGITETKQFLRELKKSFPLSEVSATNIDERSSKITTSFHYKPLGFSQIDFHSPLRLTTTKEEELLAKLQALESGRTSFFSQ